MLIKKQYLKIAPITHCISEINNALMLLYECIIYMSIQSIAIINKKQEISGKIIEMNQFWLILVLLLILLLPITVLRLNFKKNLQVKQLLMVKKMKILKHLSNSWRTLEMPLINWEINLILSWFNKCVLSKSFMKSTDHLPLMFPGAI